jgi:3'(2'), 5'-bisphosphate nucleotidase
MPEIDEPVYPTVELMQIALEAALSAGRAIMEIYSTDFEVAYKNDLSPLTLADTTSDRIINNYLFPTGIPVVSEESAIAEYARRQSWEMLWMVDPLDGTTEFVRRSAEFTVNIALILKQKPVLGVIYAPATGDLYFGMASFGSFFKRIDLELGTGKPSASEIIATSNRLPEITADGNDFVVQASRTHLNTKTRRFINGLKQMHPHLRIVARGSSLKLCAVADGSCQVYPRFGPTMEWDTAAGHAIIIQVGGTVTEALNGFSLTYNKKSLLNPDFIAKR